MLRRVPLALLLGLAVAASARAPLARADDPPAAPPAAPDAPKPDAPKEPPKKDKAPDHDDTSIFKDWGLVKRFGGIQRSKDRAAYWEQKGVSGKDLFWLARMWERGEVFDKAAAVYEQYLGWSPPEPDKHAFETNSEAARQLLASVYFWAKKYPEAVKAASKFREDFPQNRDASFSYIWEGRAERMQGHEDKAIEAFTKASEAKILKGVMDLVDLHLVAGRVDAARDALGKFPAEGAQVATLEIAKGFLNLVGTDAPDIEKAVNVGLSDSAPKTWKGHVTAVYHWHMQLNFALRRLQLFDAAARDVANSNTVALSTYNKLNPQTQKIENDMTPEAELEWYLKQVADWPHNIPYTLVVPKETLEAMGLKNEGQMEVVDAEGKIRWMRLNDGDNYDRLALTLAMEKLATPEKKN